MDTFEVAVNKLEHFTQASLPTDHPLFVQVGTHNQFTISENHECFLGKMLYFHDFSAPWEILFAVHQTVTPHAHALQLHCFCTGESCLCHAV